MRMDVNREVVKLDPIIRPESGSIRSLREGFEELLSGRVHLPSLSDSESTTVQTDPTLVKRAMPLEWGNVWVRKKMKNCSEEPVLRNDVEPPDDLIFRFSVTARPNLL